MYKKAIGPVVATSLLIVLVVAAVVGFQTWFGTYSSNLNNDIEIESSQTFNSDGIISLIDYDIYFKASQITNVTAIKANNVNCNISLILNPGITNISVYSCIDNISASDIEITLLTDKDVFVKKFSNGKNSHSYIVDNKVLPNLTFVSSLFPDLYFGESLTLNWTVINANSCVALGNWSGSKNNSSGSETFSSIYYPMSYSLTCTNLDGFVTKNITLGVVDRYWSNVVLSLQPDNLDSSFNDSSNSNHSLNPSGQVNLTNNVNDPWNGNRKLITFDGNGDALNITTSSDFDFGNENFTIEGWVYVNDKTNHNYILSKNAGLDGIAIVLLSTGSGGYLTFFAGDGSSWFINLPNTGANLNINNWHHFALVRAGNNWTLYVNGTNVYNIVSSSSIGPNSADLMIGGYTGLTSNYMDGYITGLRITKGYARYSSDFAVPPVYYPIN